MLDDIYDTAHAITAVFFTWLFTLVNSNAWTAMIAVLSFIVLVIRAYKEIRSLIVRNTSAKG